MRTNKRRNFNQRVNLLRIAHKMVLDEIEILTCMELKMPRCKSESHVILLHSISFFMFLFRRFIQQYLFFFLNFYSFEFENLVAFPVNVTWHCALTIVSHGKILSFHSVIRDRKKYKHTHTMVKRKLKSVFENIRIFRVGRPFCVLFKWILGVNVHFPYVCH